MLKTTPFHPRTSPLIRAQTWRRWSGYQVASSYDPIHDREYASVRNSAALFDVSPLWKYPRCKFAGINSLRQLPPCADRRAKHSSTIAAGQRVASYP